MIKNNCLLLLGILIGWSISSMAYKPIIMAQAEEIYYEKKERLELMNRIEYLEIEIEAHEQDMGQFIDESTLMQVLKQLGVYG